MDDGRRSDIEKHSIIRFAISYGYNGKGMNNAFVGEILSGKELEVNHDQIRQPMLAEDVGYVIGCLIEQEAYGIFNLAGPEKMSKFELGCRLEKVVREHSVLTPVGSDRDYAARPIHGTLDTTKLDNLGIRVRSLYDGCKIIGEQIKQF